VASVRTRETADWLRSLSSRDGDGGHGAVGGVNLSRVNHSLGGHEHRVVFSVCVNRGMLLLFQLVAPFSLK
jgi:hypothetical protein